MINACMLLASSKRLIFNEPVIARSRVNWAEFVRCQVRFHETYSMAKSQIRVRISDVILNEQSPHRSDPLKKSAMLVCS